MIEPTPESLERLVAGLLAAGFHADADRARDALRHRRQFNAIDEESAYKIDLIVRKARPFSLSEFGRRAVVDLLPGARVPLASAEDTVLAKLEWARLPGGAEKQLADVRGILDVHTDLDLAYVERWASELGVLDLWQALRSR